MQVCRPGCAAGKDERSQLLELGVEAITVGFELVDPDVLDPQRRVVVGGRQGGAQVCADVEEVVLYPHQHATDILAQRAAGDRDAE